MKTHAPYVNEQYRVRHPEFSLIAAFSSFMAQERSEELQEFDCACQSLGDRFDTQLRVSRTMSSCTTLLLELSTVAGKIIKAITM
jgi:hypothetical protein